MPQTKTRKENRGGLVSEKVGSFFTNKGFFFKGRLILETETHYRIFDFRKQAEIDLLKTIIERVEWSEVE